MSLSNLQTFNNSAEFEQKRFDILEWLEGNILTPYFDTKGLITIGIGFQIDTIIDNRNFVMGDAGMNLTLAQEAAINAAWESTAMTRIKALPQATETQRQAKDAALCAYLDSVLGTRSFAMTDPQIKNVFDVLVLKHQDKITSLISTPSIEQIVLTSLHYNSPGLVGPGLKAAMNMADPSEARAEAWFQIRYDHKDEPKLQKRRYAEAALFGLYDADGTVSLDEAKAIYRMYTRHANEILKSGVTMENFDAKYSTKMSQANADLAGYGFSGKIAKNLDGELALACSTILSDLDNNTNQDIKNAYRKWASNAENLLLFSPTNLLVDPKTGAVSSLLDGRNITSNSVIIGDGISIVGAAGSGGDMMLGGMGNDLLIGGAGNDVIWGSSGRDVMAGGAGNDTYILDGSTQVTIEDKIGNNRVLLNGVVLSVFYRQSDGTYKSFDGKIHGAFSGGDFIVTDSNGAQIVLNEDFQSGDFGIALIDSESQTTPVTTRTIVGDYGWFDVDPETAGIQFDRDVLGNPIQDLNKPSVMDDDLNGSIGNDLILPGSGEDRVYAQAGDDQIEAGSGRDIVDGSSGDDLIQGNMGGDILIGGAGSDRLYGDNVVTETQAIINGNDDIGTGLQGDWLAGNSGDDTLITGAGNDVLTGGGGQDRLISGAGDDDILGDSDWVAQSHDWMVTYVSNVRHYQPVSGVGIALDGAADVIYVVVK